MPQPARGASFWDDTPAALPAPAQTSTRTAPRRAPRPAPATPAAPAVQPAAPEPRVAAPPPLSLVRPDGPVVATGPAGSPARPRRRRKVRKTWPVRWHHVSADTATTLPAPTLRDHVPAHQLLARMRSRYPEARATTWALLTARTPHQGATRHLYAAAAAQIELAAQLAGLGPDWTVLHSVPVGRDRLIDHVIIGPAGVFTVTTVPAGGVAARASRRKVVACGRTLVLDGPVRDGDHAHARLSEAAGLAQDPTSPDYLDVYPVVAVIGADPLEVTAAAEDVDVVRGEDLVGWLQSRPTRLRRGKVDAVIAAAVDPGVWADSPPPTVDGRPLQAWFDTYRRGVEGTTLGRYRLGRAALLVGGFTAAAGAGYGLTVAVETMSTML